MRHLPLIRAVSDAFSMESVDTLPIRLVLLDDHAAARSRLVERLAHTPRLEVVAAVADCSEALELAQELRPDAVLVETRRADNRGFEAIAAFASMSTAERPAVIAFLEIVHRDDWTDARVAGADDVLLKELPPETLVEELRRIVRRVHRTSDAD